MNRNRLAKLERAAAGIHFGYRPIKTVEEGQAIGAAILRELEDRMAWLKANPGVVVKKTPGEAKESERLLQKLNEIFGIRQSPIGGNP